MDHTKSGRLGIVFPGQGSQEKGMGRDVAEGDPEAAELWELAEKHAGASLREIFWEGDREAMTETRYQQPALVTVSLTLWKKLADSAGAASLAGHSVGEFAALAASGVLGIREVIELVCLRGRLMFEAGEGRSGKMAALLKLDRPTVDAIVREVAQGTGLELCVANYNTPEQLVVSGADEAVDQAMSKAKEKKGRAIQLPVSGAFHSSIMEEPARELAAAMERVEWRDGTIPVYLNATARPETGAGAIKEVMQRQMISPVRWTQIIGGMWSDGVRRWLEIGPRDVLTKMMRYNLAGMDGSWEASNIGSLADLERAGPGLS